MACGEWEPLWPLSWKATRGWGGGWGDPAVLTLLLAEKLPAVVVVVAAAAPTAALPQLDGGTWPRNDGGGGCVGDGDDMR
jgi:hypothetical protein